MQNVKIAFDVYKNKNEHLSCFSYQCCPACSYNCYLPFSRLYYYYKSKFQKAHELNLKICEHMEATDSIILEIVNRQYDQLCIVEESILVTQTEIHIQIKHWSSRDDKYYG